MWRWAAALTALALWPAVADACSCMPTHPQTMFCNADFVVVARVHRAFESDMSRTYKIKVRRELKMSPKAQLALQSGKLVTPRDDGMCGVWLEPRQTYLLMGSVRPGLQAHVSLCDMAVPWKQVSARQRKGVRLLYARGCDCKVATWRRSLPDANVCVSDTRSWCHHHHGVCLRTGGRCRWTSAAALRRCGQESMPSRPLPPPMP